METKKEKKENLTEDIVKIGQVLCENAKHISSFLLDSENYRSIEVDVNCHKGTSFEPANIQLEFYDVTRGFFRASSITTSSIKSCIARARRATKR